MTIKLNPDKTWLKSLILFSAFVLSLSGCLAKQAQQAREACAKGDCSQLRMIKQGSLKPNPDELDQNDKRYQFKIVESESQEERDGMLIKVHARKQCRALRYTTDEYAYAAAGPLYWSNWGMIAGGSGLAGASFAFTDNTVAFGGMLGLGSIMAIYGSSDLIGQAIYSKSTLDRVDRGEYIDCADWINLPTDGKTTTVFPGLTPNAKVLGDMVSTDGHQKIPEAALGFAYWMSPHKPAVQFQATLDDTTTPLEFMAPEPARRDWICSTLDKVTAFQTDEKEENWAILLQMTDNSELTKLPWRYPDGRSVFDTHRDYLKRCPKESRDNLWRLANSVIEEDPQSYGVFKTALNGIIRKALYRPSPKQLAKARTKPKIPSKATKKKASSKKGKPKGKRNKKKSTKAKADASKTEFGQGKAPSGRYRCISNGRIANLRIRRNGSFRMYVELENGSAVGMCDANKCVIQSVKGAALNFTEGFNSFRLSKRGYTLVLNGKTRCDLRN